MPRRWRECWHLIDSHSYRECPGGEECGRCERLAELDDEGRCENCAEEGGVIAS